MINTRPLPPAKIEYNDQYVLRPVEPSDLPQLEKALHSSLKDLYKFMDWSHHLLTREKLLERIIDQYCRYFKGEEYEFGMFDKHTGEFYVYSGFYPTARLNPHCLEIGFWTSSPHSNKGLATLTTRMLIVLLFEYFSADRIEITANLENAASLRVIEKCSFQYEGEMRNHYPKGTSQMFSEGYVQERRSVLYSLIPRDRLKLSWYDEVIQKITIYPLIENPIQLNISVKK